MGEVVYETPVKRKRVKRFKVQAYWRSMSKWIDISSHSNKGVAIIGSLFSAWVVGEPYRVIDTGE